MEIALAWVYKAYYRGFNLLLASIDGEHSIKEYNTCLSQGDSSNKQGELSINPLEIWVYVILIKFLAF